ncbi:amidase [Pseudocercospora fijiensis CIRAD86]|uniref:amidase n=1 Tax=Pseudocercospora fijiensis (strain CIRAD86) TaxID=383855 RepID=N1Q750_PSEFD|nr:amidase [Pseudocercospora fijiensis CIRAD86]EME87356.1 amidase [Pseudocercospora fijiensis CIRAD86]
MTDWQKIGQEKAQSVLNLIPPEWRLPSVPTPEQQKDVTGGFIAQFLDAQELIITETDAVGIVKNTSTGVWSAVDVAKAFCHRAAIAHQVLNCLHEIFFDAAIADAEQLDAYFAQHKKPVGMLHGLPVSLKDQFHVKGVETSMGYIGWLNTFQGKKGTGKERKFESEMVRELRSLGAVLYVKTSVPHTLMCPETINNIIGYTQNPKNRLLSSGGSSGGEGALIGARGSVVGFGTDIGGSIRIPAAFNGLYGLRPSAGRLPYEGMANSIDGQNSILSVVGPLSTTPDGLKLVTQALLSTKPWLHDPLVHDIPWRESADLAISDPIQRLTKKLTFAVMRHDGSCAPTPPVARAIEIAVQAMQKLGHQVIDWQPTVPHADIIDLASKCWDFDGGADCRRDFELSGEEMAPQVLINNKPQANAMHIMATNIAKRDVQKAYMEYWNSTAQLTVTGEPVDAIICPLAPFPSARPGLYTYLGYSVFVNVLDYTSVVVPITQVDKDVDLVATDFQGGVNELDVKTQETYDPEIYDGAHVSIQLVGRRLQEEKMIALAKYMGKAVHGRA